MRAVHALLLLGSCAGLNVFTRFEPIGRPALEKFVSSQLPPASPVTWAAEPPSGELQLVFWRWLVGAIDRERVSVLALPSLEPRDVRQLVEMVELLPSRHYKLAPLPESSPVPGVAAFVQPPPPPPPPARDTPTGVAAAVEDGDAAATAMARTAAWVDRTLSPAGLRFCPYTQSARLAGAGLEGFGVTAAPITYAHCGSAALPALLVAFWDASCAMLAQGEVGTSSIVLACPRFDARFDEWYQRVFPLLEESVLAARLGRTLGIVCFHPAYSTPDAAWLARHRFGHMYAPATLRRYVEEHDAELAAASSDDDLRWAGSYQRRSPHAMINVLWARQLEQAEQKRKSSLLYTRNVRRALGEGRDALERAAAEERER